MSCVTANTTECNFRFQLDTTLEKVALDFDFTLPDLCRTMGMSRTSLHRKITDCAGMSISIYIREFRLQKAFEKLENHSGSVSSIAYEVGFSDLAYFSKCFKKEFSVNPSDLKS